MTYFKINGHDYSPYVSKLQVGRIRNALVTGNSSGNIGYVYKNTKRRVEVGIIMVDADLMKRIQNDMENFTFDPARSVHYITISFLDPKTNTLVENMKCYPSDDVVDYYTIREGNIKFNPTTFTFNEQ